MKDEAGKAAGIKEDLHLFSLLLNLTCLAAETLENKFHDCQTVAQTICSLNAERLSSPQLQMSLTRLYLTSLCPADENKTICL